MKKKEKVIIAHFWKIWIIHILIQYFLSIPKSDTSLRRKDTVFLTLFFIITYLLIFKLNQQIIIVSIYGYNVKFKWICIYIIKWLNLDD